jgi:hypothetical protein
LRRLLWWALESRRRAMAQGGGDDVVSVVTISVGTRPGRAGGERVRMCVYRRP